MLQAHSLLWHYLWVAPNILLISLAFLLWSRGRHKQYPIFFGFAILAAIEQLVLYASDISPSVTPRTWWIIFWSGLTFEGLLKFALIGEIFALVFDPYPSLAQLGKFLIRGLGIFLVLAAAVAAGFAKKDTMFGIVTGAHLLEQTIYLVASGLLVFIFGFSAYFRLTPSRPVFGIALGLGISACVHLATWAILANGGLPTAKRGILDLVNMATYHVCVLIWSYYLLVPAKTTVNLAVALPENNLDIWNRELERLVHP